MLDALLIVAALVSVLAMIGVGVMAYAVNRAAQDEIDAAFNDVPETWADAARRARAERESAR